MNDVLIVNRYWYVGFVVMGQIFLVFVDVLKNLYLNFKLLLCICMEKKFKLLSISKMIDCDRYEVVYVFYK